MGKFRGAEAKAENLLISKRLSFINASFDSSDKTRIHTRTHTHTYTSLISLRQDSIIDDAHSKEKYLLQVVENLKRLYFTALKGERCFCASIFEAAFGSFGDGRAG